MHEDTYVTIRTAQVYNRFLSCIARGKRLMTTTKRRTGSGPQTETALEAASLPHIQRNTGMSLDMDWVRRVHINRSAVERRAATLGTRRTVKKEWQAAWLLRAITCIDLTTLAGDDTPGNVLRLCAKARQPVRSELLASLGVNDFALHVGSVCVYKNLVLVAVVAVPCSVLPVAALMTSV